jgi:hypothetical protein
MSTFLLTSSNISRLPNTSAYGTHPAQPTAALSLIKP